MIIQQEAKEQNVVVGGGFKQKEFKIKNKEFIFDVLSDKIYNNKIGAIVREIISNAVDANIEVKNVKDKVVVHLPSGDEPYFFVRDFGPGMDTERINVFISFGDSTKRDSEDQIGYFGMGSKSPFAYSDSFYITTWCNGFKWEYMAYIDDERKRNLMLLNKTKSEDKNGTEVRINISNDSDLRRFSEEFFSIWGFSIHLFELPGLDVDEEKACRKFHPHLFQKFHNRKNVMFGNYGHYPSNPGIIVMNGSIAYELDYSTISNLSRYGNMTEFDQNHSFYSTHGIIIKLKVGDLKLSVNRESLEICESNANVINNAVVGLYNEIRNGVRKIYEESKNSFFKLRNFHKTYGKLNFVMRCPYSIPYSVSNTMYSATQFEDIITLDKHRESDMMYPLSENVWFYFVKGSLDKIDGRIRKAFSNDEFLQELNVLKFNSENDFNTFKQKYPLVPLIPLHAYEPIINRRKNQRISKDVQLINALKDEKITLDNGKKVHPYHFENEKENKSTDKYFIITSFGDPIIEDDSIPNDERLIIRNMMKYNWNSKLQEYTTDPKIKIFKFTSTVRKHIPKDWKSVIPVYSNFIRNGNYNKNFEDMIISFYMKTVFDHFYMPDFVRNKLMNIIVPKNHSYMEGDNLYRVIIKYNKNIRKLIATKLKSIRKIVNHICMNFPGIFIINNYHTNRFVTQLRETAIKNTVAYLKTIKGV